MPTTATAAAPAVPTDDQVTHWLERVRDFVASSPDAKANAQRAIDLIRERQELIDTMVAFEAIALGPQQ